MKRIESWKGLLKMKIDKVFEGLLKNRKSVYQTNDAGLRYELSIKGMGYFYLKIFDSVGELINSEFPGGSFNGNISFDLNWELVPQEVPWEVAIQAWVNGKTVICKVSAEDNRVGMAAWFTFDGKLSESRYPLGKLEISKGKWYIEQ